MFVVRVAVAPAHNPMVCSRQIVIVRKLNYVDAVWAEQCSRGFLLFITIRIISL